MGHRGRRDPHRDRHRRHGIGHVGDDPSVGQSRALLPDRRGRRSHLRQGRLVLPVRSPVLPLRPVARGEPAPGQPRRRRRPLPRAGHGGFAGLHHARPGASRRPGGPVSPGHRLRLSARQVRARLQHLRRRDRHRLHGLSRPVHGLRRPDVPVRAGRRTAGRRCVHPLAVAAGRDRDHLVQRKHRAGTPLSGGDPAAHRRPQRVRAGAAVHREQHRDDAARVRPRQVGDAQLPGHGHALGDRGRGRGRHLRERAPVGLPPAPDDAGPAPDDQAVLRLQGRGHGPLPGQRAGPAGHALGPRARHRPQPAGHQLGQPAGHLHARHRRRHGPCQRGDPRGPAAPVDPRPAAGVVGGRSRGQAAAYLLRRGRQPLRDHRRPPAGVRHPLQRPRSSSRVSTSARPTTTT
jgi:hypothetical protein